MRYDRARVSLDRHATYIVSTYIAGAARWRRRPFGRRQIPAGTQGQGSGNHTVSAFGVVEEVAERRARTKTIATLPAAQNGTSGLPALSAHASRLVARATYRQASLGGSLDPEGCLDLLRYRTCPFSLLLGSGQDPGPAVAWPV